MSSCYAILPAAGSSLRFGGDTKKQFIQLDGELLVHRSIRLFLETGLFDQIVVCLPAEDVKTIDNPFDATKVRYVAGGHSRSESVYNGIQALDLKDDDIVLIHDAVRCLVTPALIRRVYDATREHRAVIPAVPLTDTIKEVADSYVVKTIDRNQLKAVQTPQGFSCSLLQKQYKEASLDQAATDEAMLAEAVGEKVFVVEGEVTNIKITTPFDLEVAKLLLAEGKI